MYRETSSPQVTGSAAAALADDVPSESVDTGRLGLVDTAGRLASLDTGRKSVDTGHGRSDTKYERSSSTSPPRPPGSLSLLAADMPLMHGGRDSVVMGSDDMHSDCSSQESSTATNNRLLDHPATDHTRRQHYDVYYGGPGPHADMVDCTSAQLLDAQQHVPHHHHHHHHHHQELIQRQRRQLSVNLTTYRRTAAADDESAVVETELYDRDHHQSYYSHHHQMSPLAHHQ